MRVVIVNKYAHLTGGADQHCLGLGAALSRRGHEVRFLSTRDEKNVVSDGEFVRTTVTHGSREEVALREQANVFAKALWNAEAAAAMRRLLDEFRPDIVHTHKLYPQLSVAPVVVATRAGVPVVQTLHDFEMISASPLDARGGAWDKDETRLRFKLLNSATRPVHRRVHAPRVSAFIAVSRFVARIHSARGIDASVLPNFVVYGESELEQPLPFRQRSGIMFIGRMRSEKGALDVVELARKVPDIPVTMVGSGALEPTIRSAATRVPNLQVAGFVPHPELSKILGRARVVVIPSRCHDAGPLVPLEAMAHGTPVVAYAMGGLGEYVADAGGGRVVPVDVETLATTAAELHVERATWDALSSAGIAAVARRHNPDVYAEQLESLYQEVVHVIGGNTDVEA